PTADKTDKLIDRNTNRFEVEIAVPGEDGSELHDEVILMVDGSYSMDNEWPAMKEAITTIGKTVLNGSGNTQLTLMAFGMGDNEVLVHVKDADDLAAALGELPGNLLYGRSSTNCEAGFTGVANYIKNHDKTLNEVQVIFISDGNLNTDETPRDFYFNWKTWTKFGALTVAQVAFEETVLYGTKLPDAFRVFGDRFNGMSNEALLDYAFGGGVTNEEFIEFCNEVYKDVYAYSGLHVGIEYPVSVVERAFVKYDKEKGTYIQDAFYYTTYQSSYVTYPNRVNRAVAAAEKLAAMENVEAMYLIDTNSATAWMRDSVTNAKVDFIQCNGVASMLPAIEGALTNLSKTPFNNVVITDYMSKWVNLDASTLKIVDNSTDAVIWSAAEGWKINENRPTAQEVPVVVELVSADGYAAGGEDVIGNTSGDIYKLTWYVKDGAMLRSDTYSLKYEVFVDTAEDGFQNNVLYPANGNTDLHYKDENGGDQTKEIDVPDVKGEKPKTPTVSFNSGDASNISFMLVDKDGKVEFLKKIDIGNETSFDIPTEPGKVSAVFVKQSTSGMFWFSEGVDEDIQNAVIECLKANNPSYKGHNAIAFGAGDHDLEFKKGKFVTYTFTGFDVVTNVTKSVENEEVPAPSPVVTPETPAPAPEAKGELTVDVEGADITSWTVKGDVTAIYIAAKSKIPAVVWTSEEVADMTEIIEELGAPEDATIVFDFGEKTIEYNQNKNKKASVVYTFIDLKAEAEVAVAEE
ncbi:MAG: VWA domain-containing protein, partial [Oscillospiraceae bacterium]|nr:VWA domain-containing protein [Oscillospiraceae bacterium]